MAFDKKRIILNLQLGTVQETILYATLALRFCDTDFSKNCPVFLFSHTNYNIKIGPKIVLLFSLRKALSLKYLKTSFQTVLKEPKTLSELLTKLQQTFVA